MASTQQRTMGQYLLVIVIVAVIAAVAAHGIQIWIFGGANTAVTAGVAGALSATVAFRGGKRPPSD